MLKVSHLLKSPSLVCEDHNFTYYGTSGCLYHLGPRMRTVLPYAAVAHSLRKSERDTDLILQRHLLCSLNAFPGGGQLDQDAFLVYSLGSEHRNELPRLADARLLVETESGIHFNAHTAGNDLQDLAAEQDEQFVYCFAHLFYLSAEKKTNKKKIR